MKLLLELLPRYCEHVEKHPHTLLIKFYGLHRVRPLKGAKVASPALLAPPDNKDSRSRDIQG